MAIRNSASPPGRWGDEDFVRVWDSQPTSPLKAEQLDIITEVIRRNWRKGARILDLGCGTGKAEELIFDRLPVARFVCVDRSEVMLGLARKKLRRFGDQCVFVQADLARLNRAVIPGSSFRFIISMDAIHELEDRSKLRLLRYCCDHLARDGFLLILDRLALDLAHFRIPLAGVLKRLQREARSQSGQLSDCFVDHRSRDHEYPLTLESYFRLLRKAGFDAALLHLHLHKAVIVARPFRRVD